MIKMKFPFALTPWHSDDVKALQSEFYFATNGIFLLVFEGWAEDLVTALFYVWPYAD